MSREDGQLEASRQNLLVTVSRGAELRNQLTKAEEMGLALDRQLIRLSSEANSLEGEHRQLSAQCEAFGLDHEREASSLSQLSENVAETTTALDEARLQASRHEAEVQALQQELSGAAARKQAIEESLAQHAYSTEPVRRLLSDPIPVNGHHFRPLGVLADFVEVAPGYEEPIEEFRKKRSTMWLSSATRKRGRASRCSRARARAARLFS
jgi:DNA repair exonuclease SbcCD ATPase subunit